VIAHTLHRWRAAQDGWTALHHAASDGDVVVVRALLEGGASRKIKNEDGKSARKVAAEAGNESVVTLFRQWSLFEGDSDVRFPASFSPFPSFPH